MANRKVSALDTATALAGDEKIYVVQGGSSKQTPIGTNLATLKARTDPPGSKGLAILEDTTSDAVHEELARDWSGGTSGAPTLSLPNVMQRRYVDIGAYCSLTDTTSARAGIVAALASGVEGREFVLTNPYGGTRYYKVPDRAGGRIYLPTAKTFRLICEPGAIVDFSDWGNGVGLTSEPYFYGTGTAGTEHALTATATNDTNTVTVSAADSANYARGDDIFVRSGGLFTTEDSTLGTQGEWASVVDVNTTTGVLTLGAKLRATYNAAPHADAAYITKVTPISGSVENLNIIGAGRFADNTSADRGLQIVNGKNFKVLGGDFKFCDFNQVAFVNVLNGLVDGTRILFDQKGATTGLQYGVGFNNMCENTWARNCDINGGSEGLVLSTTGQPQGVTRDVGFESCRVRGSTRSGACSHDNHENWSVINCTFEDCEQGIDHRINGLVATGNTMRRMGAYSGSLSTGLLLGSGAGKVLFANNVLEDMVRGVWHASTTIDETATGAVGDIMISGNVMRNITSHGVLYDVEATDDTTARGAIAVIGNDISMATSGTTPVGVDIEGNWDKPVVAGNTFRGGNAGRSVFLHNTSAGVSGPVSPTVVNNVYDNFTAPAVSHQSGLLTAFGNRQIGDTAPDPVTLTTFGVAAAPTLGIYTVTSFSGTADDLDSITAMAAGSRVTYKATSTHTITVRNNGGGTGNIRTRSGASVVLTGDKTIVLVCDGTNWVEESLGHDEGTFTPAISFDTAGDLAVTYSTQTGRYTKIGRVVFFDLTIVTSAFTHTTASGALRVTGLPFTAAATYNTAGAVEWQGITKATYTDATARVVAGQAYANVIASGSGVGNLAVAFGDMPTGGSVRLAISGHYTV